MLSYGGRQINNKLNTFQFLGSYSTGNNGAASLTTSAIFKADQLYLAFIRRLNGKNDVYFPYAYLFYVRDNAWASITIGEASEVTNREISGSKMTLTFKSTQWTRMTVYRVM